MNRVLDRLWIGSTEDFRAPLAALGFSAVVDLRDGVTTLVDKVPVFNIDNRDGDPWSAKQVIEALDFVHSMIQHGNVLIACAAGMSRSASMTIGYLVRSGWDVTEAFERVRDVRPRIQPVQKMLNSVMAAIRS